MSAFEDGVAAYNNGESPDSNQYPEGSKERADWFDGWEAGAECEEEM